MAKRGTKVKSAAATLGKLGGEARAKALSKDELRAIAAKGGAAGKGSKKPGSGRKKARSRGRTK